MNHPGLSGKQIGEIFLAEMIPDRWYLTAQILSIVENSGELTVNDRREIGSKQLQWQRRTLNAIRDLHKKGTLEKTIDATKKWQYRRPT